jgi:hypothetical protein
MFTQINYNKIVSESSMYIDIWLLKLLGGEINWILSKNEEIPDGILAYDEQA